MILTLAIGIGLTTMAPINISASAQGSLFDKAKGAIKSFGGAKSGGTSSIAGLSNDEIGRGLKEALRVGTERVVGQLGAVDGFNADGKIHIPLPDTLKKVQSMLRGVGLAGLADDLELRLNRAAEAAAPEAKALFWQSISELTLNDVQRIYKGPQDAATRYFEKQMTAPLAKLMEPVIDQSLAEVGAIAAYDTMMAQYKSMPFVPDVKADLREYVVVEAMKGIFHYVAQEEAAIRANPAKRTTDLLKRVFAN
ncbi:MAG: DUF4197 domain-containing protein [Alphaproteobacteria bacterium]|nr:DUF4197 domain-containing protein [Alphaproteobacteria bacterium]